MLSLQKKFLFIHVPKTGGNSVQNIIREFSEDRIIKNAHDHDGFEEFEVRNDQYAFNKHSTYRDYKSQIEASVFQKLYKFAHDWISPILPCRTATNPSGSITPTITTPN